MLGNIIGIIIFLAAAGGFGYLIYTRRKAKAAENVAKEAEKAAWSEQLNKRKAEPVPTPNPAPAPEPNPAPVEPPKESA